MSLFLTIFTKNVLPAFLVIAMGVLLDRKLHVDKKSLSRTAIYILTPCLIFSSISRSAVSPGQFGQMILFVIVFTILMAALALLVGHLLKWPARTRNALVLSVAFVNAGNFGLPIVLLTYGEVGLELATIFYVASNFTCNTLAAFFAARGNGSEWKAVLKALKLPGIYAFILAIVMRSLQVATPEVLLKPVQIIAGATVPVMLMLLGIQLSQAHVSKRYKEIGVGVIMRLVVGALAAIGLVPLIGLQGLARQVAITEASTPTAVNSVLMAIEFDGDAEFVTSVLFVSTLLSSITLTLIFSLLGT